MIRKVTLAAALAALLVSCASTAPSSRAPLTDIAGVRLDMPRDTVRTTLAETAKFEREERKRQEIWTLRNDPRYASLIIGYSPEWNVRYVTAVARPDGEAVRAADVLDLAVAEDRAAGATHTYTWATGTPKYYIIGIGGPERLEYLSLKKDPS
ncbi:MAG TPA: hypothetical protein VEK57_21945 [Thermoanaerobaculia bacterium]|nr:hypothetical protein [Thermoanaerobaculia bacterium]